MAVSVQTLPLTVMLAAPLLAQHANSQRMIRKRIEMEVSELLNDLGIDARPKVRLEVGTVLEGLNTISVLIDGRPLRFPREILSEATAYVDGVTEVSDNAYDAFAALQSGPLAAGSASVVRLGEILASLCYSAISVCPELVFDAVGCANVRQLDHLIEERNESRPDGTIDVQVEREYLSLLIGESTDGDLFPFVRSGLFDELGLWIPPFHLIADSSLKPRGFRFRINGIQTLPRIGLPAHKILVNDIPERLVGYGVDATGTLNPATWKPAALTDRSYKDSLEERGLTTWDPWGYLILSFATALRNSAHRLITRVVTTEILSQLATLYPFLGRAVDAHVPIDEVSAVLRELLLDGVSIRNMRRIAELLLHYETTDGQVHGLDRLSFVRSGMADAIAYRLSRGTGTVVVYLLDSQIEHAILQQDTDPALPDRLLAAVRDELAYLPRTALTPVIVTQAQTRARIRELLRGAFPYVSVVAYGELPLHYNIQPVARLSLK
jgi:type III secretory pathway component EscV